ncbi:MAG: ABC transporter ATP-binding protein [Anaerolineae bacterium]|nr:MAG: ABC transporter ATP-binding protein [Anaerolineae bacterium]
MPALIETHSLTKQFGDLVAVDDVSLRVEAGEILALLGPNGAGKTTTIRMLASILRPTRGWVRVAGFDTAVDAAKVRHQVGLLTEHHGLYTRMKAREYLAYFGSIYGLDPDQSAQRAVELLDRFGLSDAYNQRLGQYSKGMRQKLAMARALLHDPEVLLLDEPTSAMDPESARMVRESILGLRSGNRAIVVCTHNLHEAEALADRIAIIRRGGIVAQGTADQLMQDYLGSPIMELKVAGQLDGAARLLPEGVQIREQGYDWFRFQASDPEQINPQIIENMAAAGVRIVTLSEVKRSLEDVYLSVMQREAQE